MNLQNETFRQEILVLVRYGAECVLWDVTFVAKVGPVWGLWVVWSEQCTEQEDVHLLPHPPPCTACYLHKDFLVVVLASHSQIK